MKALCLTVVACASAASAQTVFMDIAPITEGAQGFEFTFDTVPLAISEGTLTIEALGDYNPLGAVTGQADEDLTWDIDGIAGGVGFEADDFNTDPVDLFQNSVSATFTISLADMQAITGDGAFTITLQNGVNVGNFETDDFVSFTLSYFPVPSPGAAATLGLGGLAMARRRR